MKLDSFLADLKSLRFLAVGLSAVVLILNGCGGGEAQPVAGQTTFGADGLRTASPLAVSKTNQSFEKRLQKTRSYLEMENKPFSNALASELDSKNHYDEPIFITPVSIDELHAHNGGSLSGVRKRDDKDHHYEIIVNQSLRTTGDIALALAMGMEILKVRIELDDYLSENSNVKMNLNIENIKTGLNQLDAGTFSISNLDDSTPIIMKILFFAQYRAFRAANHLVSEGARFSHETDTIDESSIYRVYVAPLFSPGAALSDDEVIKFLKQIHDSGISKVSKLLDSLNHG